MRRALVLALVGAGLFAPSAVAASPHTLGLMPNPAARAPGNGVGDAALPASADLTRWAPLVGNQGSANSCTSWAIDHSFMGWLSNRYGLGWSPLAPMYSYVQLDQGRDQGTYFSDQLNLAQTQGIAPADDYSSAYGAEQDFSLGNLPTPLEHADAANHRLSGWVTLFSGRYGRSPQNTLWPYPGQDAGAQQTIEATLAAGKPVLLGIQIWNQFEAGESDGTPIDLPSGGLQPDANATFYGLHAVTVFAYDQRGVEIENQWGTTWSQGGWAWLSWSFVNHLVEEAYTYGSPSLPPSPTPSGYCLTHRPRWAHRRCWSSYRAYRRAFYRAHRRHVHRHHHTGVT